MADASARFILTAEDRASRALKGVQGKLDGLKNTASGVGRAFGLLAGGGFAAFAAKSIQSADQIQKLSLRLGISTEALSQYKFVAQQTGVEFNTLTTGLQRMTRRISEAASGTGEAKNALAELGLSAEQLNALKPDQQFEILADAMGRVENQADKVRLAMRLFDTEGVALLQTMEGGSQAINALREEADRLGLTLDQHVANTAAEASDALGRLGATGQALSVSLAKSLGPTLADVANWLSVNIPDAVEGARKAFRGMELIITDVNASLSEFAAEGNKALAEGARFFGFDSLAESLEKGAKEAEENAAKLKQEFKDLVDTAIAEEQRFKSSVADAPSFETYFNAERAAQARNAISRRGMGRGSTTASNVERATAAMDEHLAVYERLKREADALTERLRTPWEVATDNLEIYDDLLERNLITQETWARATNEALDSVNETASELPGKAEEIDETWKDLGSTVSSAFEDAIVNGEKFSDVLESLAKDVLPALSKQLVEALSTSTSAQGGTAGSGGGFAAFSSFFTNLFQRQHGGPVSAGVPYLVGERGPEILVPSTSGNVLPNGRMPAGQSVTIGNININGVGDRVDTASASQFATRVGQEIQRQLRRNG